MLKKEILTNKLLRVDNPIIRKSTRLFFLLVLISFLLTTAEAKRHPKQDKSELYKRFPQLTSNNTDECIKGLNRLLTNLYEYPYSLMLFYSLHAINEFGFHEQCQRDLGEWADFAVMNSNISHIAGASRMGLCLPKECKQHHYDAYSKMSESQANWFFATLPKYGIVLDGSLFRYDTQVTLAVTKSDDYHEKWVDRTTAGFYPSIIIIAILILVAVAATTYAYSVYKFGRLPKVQTFVEDTSAS